MDIKAIEKRIDEQINESTASYHLPVNQLKYDTNVFKPDSLKLETVVSVDIGHKDLLTQSIVATRYFYSPKKYNYIRAEDLKNDIEQYLENLKLNSLVNP